MSIRRLQGWALIVSAVLGLVDLTGLGPPVIVVIGILLFMFGVPAIQSVQPSGRSMMVGVILVEFAALIALGFRIDLLSEGSAIGAALPLASAIAGSLGRVIIGWLTTREKVFAPWVGWAFILEGVLILLGGVLPLPALASLVGGLSQPVGAAALAGYGVGIIRHADRVLKNQSLA